MTTITKEIEIEGVPEGWEVVRFGVPKYGDSYLDGGSLHHHGGKVSTARLIVRRAYQWPDFIPEGWWLIKSVSDRWITCKDEPLHFQEHWEYANGIHVVGSNGQPKSGYAIDITDLIWTPPTVTDWRTSKMQKPKVSK